MTLGGRGMAGRRPQINRIRGNISEQLTNSAVDAHPYPLNVARIAPRSLRIRSASALGSAGRSPFRKSITARTRRAFFSTTSSCVASRPFDNFLTVPTVDERDGEFRRDLRRFTIRNLIPLVRAQLFQITMIPAARFDPAASGLLPLHSTAQSSRHGAKLSSSRTVALPELIA